MGLFGVAKYRDDGESLKVIVYVLRKGYACSAKECGAKLEGGYFHKSKLHFFWAFAGSVAIFRLCLFSLHKIFCFDLAVRRF